MATNPTSSTTSTVTPSPGLSPHARLGVFGLALIGFTPAVLFLIALATGLPLDEGIFFLVVAAVALIAAAVIARDRTWARIVGLVVTALAVFAMFWVAFGLAFPASPADFVPGLAFLLGTVLALVGNIGGLVRGRRAGETTGTGLNADRWIRGSLAIVATATVVSVGLAVGTGATVAAGPAEQADAAVTMEQFQFTEANYTVPDGASTILVANADAFVHNFTVPELDIAVTLNPGDEVLVPVDASTGQYIVYCTLHADTSVANPDEAGMAAALEVG